jgi:nucleoside-diphosphate-sugar epimerase
MRVCLLTPPGRFPTVSRDAGSCLDLLAAADVQFYGADANFEWWNGVCASSSAALAALCSGAAFASMEAYCGELEDLERCAKELSCAQNEYEVSFADGPIVRGLDYDSSGALMDFLHREGPLSGSVSAALAATGALDRLQTFDVVLMRVTSAFDLLAGSILCRLIRRQRPHLHICLYDHGYENFSLSAHLNKWGSASPLLEVFDSIIGEKDDIDFILPRLLGRLATKRNASGVLDRKGMATDPVMPQQRGGQRTVVTARLDQAFVPTRILQMRLSSGGCYWGRCSFCTHNSKYKSEAAPGKTSLDSAINRIEAFASIGCDTFVFADEALSPAMLRAFSERLVARQIDVKWTCRSKLERSFSPDLIRLCANAGCREILFGLESSSGALLRRMDKFVVGLQEAEIANIFRAIADEGIGVHVNLINGFPGEDINEAHDTVSFVVNCLRDHPNATFGLNRFTVFPGSPMAADPQAWGLQYLCSEGDMPSSIAHRFAPELAPRTAPVLAAFDELQGRLEQELGWAELAKRGGGARAFELYSTSGHGVYLKTLPANPIDQWRQRSRRSAPAPSPRRRLAFVTGGTGAVGTAVMAELERKKWDVIGLARDIEAGARLNCHFILGDLADLPSLDGVLGETDAIIHCASPRSMDRTTALRSDVEATGRLLDAWSAGRLIYTSSQTIYGLPSGILEEKSGAAPDNWYDLAKITNEHQIQFRARELGAIGISLRLPLVLSGSCRPGTGNYLLDIMGALERGDRFVLSSRGDWDVFGTVYITDRDLGAAVLSAVGLTESGSYNVASGFVTWRDLIMMLGASSGIVPNFGTLDVAFASISGRDFFLPRSRTDYDVTKFADSSGFVPENDIDEMITRFVANYCGGKAGHSPAQRFDKCVAA